jgi:pyridoxal phosphate enzyme (YggS family)
MQDIEENLKQVREDIERALQRAGRSSEEVTLIAVSKTHPAESVREVINAGHLLFGESRVQEARAKIPLLPSAARWHFIGHLQKNKIRQALPLFELIHSVDSLELAQSIDRIAKELGLHPRVLLEVNIAEEASKHGFARDSLRKIIGQMIVLERLQIEGLMTIAPYSAEPENSRSYFASLRELRDSLEDTELIGLPTLSMGMSGDFGVAIEEGATMVRIGTSIFGRRSALKKTRAAI